MLFCTDVSPNAPSVWVGSIVTGYTVAGFAIRQQPQRHRVHQRTQNPTTSRPSTTLRTAPACRRGRRGRPYRGGR